MLVCPPPRFESAAHARHILETVFNEISRRSQTAVPVITVHDHWHLFVGILNKILNIAVVEMERAGNVRRTIRTRVANIDEHAFFFVELLLGLVYLDLGDQFHRSNSSKRKE